jgi:hypothetical protein
MELSKFAIEVYLFFTGKIYSRPAIGERKAPKAVAAIEAFGKLFQERYGEAVGAHYVWFYVAYQFARYDLVNFRPKGIKPFVTATLVFQKSAVEKFGHRKTIDALTMRAPFLAKHGINKQDFVKETGFTFTADMSKVNHKKVEKILQTYQDPIKAVTVRDKIGWGLCEEMTDLYNDQDLSCQKCPYAVDCKQELKKLYPKIYALRYE